METLNARSMLNDATSAVNHAPVERRRRLSQAALAVASQMVRPAYSPIVIAGVVRLTDFISLSLVGIGIYFGHVVPISGFHLEYLAAILAMTAATVISFQAADIYQVQMFRGQLGQMTRMISAWAFAFLLFIGVSFFAKVGSEISRLWLAAFFVVGLAVLTIERLCLRALMRSRARQGRLDRRTVIVGSDESGEQLIQALRGQCDSLLADSVGPRVNVLRMPNDETNVMHHLHLSRFAGLRQLMQGEVILTGSEIRVFFVGHPFQFHTENVGIELQRSTNVPDV